MQEAIFAGVPLITIALFGDQPKNAKIARKHGIALNNQKETISKDAIVEALREILENDSYKKNVKRLSAMVRAQSMKPSERLLKWSEFLAEFKSLENLEPAGQKLNLFQYYSFDVIGFIITVSLCICYILFYISKVLIRLTCFKATNKEKTD